MVVLTRAPTAPEVASDRDSRSKAISAHEVQIVKFGENEEGGRNQAVEESMWGWVLVKSDADTYYTELSDLPLHGIVLGIGYSDGSFDCVFGGPLSWAIHWA